MSHAACPLCPWLIFDRWAILRSSMLYRSVIRFSSTIHNARYYNMKVTSVLGLFFGLVTASVAQSDAAKLQVGKASDEFVRAVKAGDLQVLERLQSPAMVYVAANNRRMTREEVFTALKADFGKWSLHDTVIEACQVFGDTVVTTGTEEVRAESGARAGTRSLRRFTNVWQRSGSAWVMISRCVAVVQSPTPNRQRAGQ